MDEPVHQYDGDRNGIEDMYLNEPQGVVLVPDTPPLPQPAQRVQAIVDLTHDDEDEISSYSGETKSSGLDIPSNVEQLESAAKQVLRKVLRNSRAEWTCKEQKEAVLTVLQLNQDAVIVMRTGSGKTMLPIIASQLETDRVTIVVLPLKSLMFDYMRRLKDMGIAYEVFLGARTKALSGAHNLVLVSADMRKGAHWKQCLAELNERKPVVRTIFDEGQYAFTANDFRSALCDLDEIRLFPMQLIVMSGTIPPHCEQVIIESFGLNPEAKVIRTSSDRPELEYILEPARTTQDITDRLKTIVRRHLNTMNEDDRILVFVPYLDEGRRLANILDCQFYSGSDDTSDDERQKMHRDWIDGVHRVMVCTSAFGSGNDYASVRVVAHAGSPGEFIGYRYIKNLYDL
jgi:superfamily II DNA helicase RecQ